jgi:hypothetical protein
LQHGDIRCEVELSRFGDPYQHAAEKPSSLRMGAPMYVNEIVAASTDPEIPPLLRSERQSCHLASAQSFH